MAIIGHSGSVKVGASTVGTAKNWSVDLTKDTVDTTTFASGGWKENTDTLKGWSGNITVIFDAGADAGEALLADDIFASGTVVALELLTNATGSGSYEKFAGDAKVTSMPVSQDVNGVVEVTFAFIGTGALTASGVV